MQGSAPSARSREAVAWLLALVAAGLTAAFVHRVPAATRHDVFSTLGFLLVWVVLIRFAPQVAAVMVGCMGFFLAAIGAVSVLAARTGAAAAAATLITGLGLFLTLGAAAFFQRAAGRRWRPWLQAAVGILGAAAIAVLVQLLR